MITVSDDDLRDTSEAPTRAGGTARVAAAAASLRIAELTERTDRIDQLLIALWRRRLSLSLQVSAARAAVGGARLTLAREQEFLRRFHRELGPIGVELGLLVLRAGRGTDLAAGHLRDVADPSGSGESREGSLRPSA